MATEIELKLSLAPGDARKLREHARLAGQPSRRRLLRNTYYDTPQLDLLQLYVAVRFRQIGRQWLLTVKSGEPAAGGLARRSEWECPAIPGRFDFSFVDAAELRHRLEALAPKLEPVFATHFHRTTWVVESGGAHIEVAFDRGRIHSGERNLPICEVEMELVDGDIGEIFALARSLQQALHLRPMVASKAERGYLLRAGGPAQPFKAQQTPVTPAMTPEEAFRSIAFACLEHLQRNEVLSRDQADPEFVHQARVALRRLRSALKLFAPVLPEAILAYGAVWKILATTLGEARNWEIFVGETLPALNTTFPQSDELRRLEHGGRQQAVKARRSAERLFSSAEYSHALLGFTAALVALPEAGNATADVFARQRLNQLARRAKRQARRCTGTDGESWHQLRIRLKELRYALEFFSPLMPRKQFKPYSSALTKIQNELGLVNDHRTAGLLIDRLPGRSSNLVRGWVAGRTALLMARLPKAVARLLAQPAPWKHP